MGFNWARHMHPRLELLQATTRRHFLQTSSLGLGGLALSSLLGRRPAPTRRQSENPLAPRKPHFAREGEAGHLPAHVRRAAAPRPVRLQAGAGRSTTARTAPTSSSRASGSRSRPACRSCSARRSSSSSTARPASGCPTRSRTLHDVADDCDVIRSMHTDQFNHAPAELLLYTGSPRQGRPSMGSWVTYGLGTENENLPGFVVLISSGVQPSGGQGLLGQRLPAVASSRACSAAARATRCCTSRDPPGMDRDMRRLEPRRAAAT